MPKWVYVGQYGYFWRLTLEQWRNLLEQSTRTGSYDLTGYRELKQKPRWLMKNPDCAGYTRLTNNVLYYEPLDWTEDDFAAALAEIASMECHDHESVGTDHGAVHDTREQTD